MADREIIRLGESGRDDHSNIKKSKSLRFGKTLSNVVSLSWIKVLARPYNLMLGSFAATLLASESFLRIFGTQTYNDSFRVPLINPMGVDFRFVYKASKTIITNLGALVEVKNFVYTPAVAVFALPLTLFNENRAYLVFTVILNISLLIGLALAIRWPAISVDSRSSRYANQVSFILLWFIVLYHTYPFQFALERGNFDTIAAVLSISALVLLSKGKEMSAVTCLGIGILLKLYLIVLVPLVLLRVGRRSLLYFVVLEALGIVYLGPVGIRHFLASLIMISKEPYIWWGNHSLTSFLSRLGYYLDPSRIPYIWFVACFILAIPILLLSLKNSLLLRGPNRSRLIKLNDRSVISTLGMCFAFMCLFPNTSHDYKLIVVAFPFLILLSVVRELSVASVWFAASLVVVAVSTALILTLPLVAITMPKTPFILSSFFGYLFLYFSLPSESQTRGYP